MQVAVGQTHAAGFGAEDQVCVVFFVEEEFRSIPSLAGEFVMTPFAVCIAPVMAVSACFGRAPSLLARLGAGGFQGFDAAMPHYRMNSPLRIDCLAVRIHQAV